MAQKYYAAADIGGTKVALGLFGEDKTLVGKGQFASDPGLPGEAFFTQVVEELRALCREHEVDPAGLAGLGIGVPGMVKFYEGRVALCAMLPGLGGWRWLCYYAFAGLIFLGFLFNNGYLTGAVSFLYANF